MNTELKFSTPQVQRSTWVSHAVEPHLTGEYGTSDGEHDCRTRKSAYISKTIDTHV